MKKLTMFLLCLLSATLLSQSQFSVRSQGERNPLVISHVTVIDATGSAAKPDMTVVIQGDRITELGNSMEIRVPQDARLVDAAGKFLIPGLCDMHIHWSQKEYLSLFIANGVTSARVMWGFPMHHEWRSEITNGRLVGPRLSIASPIVDGPKPVRRGSLAVSKEAERRQAVIKSKQDGADFIKVYSLLPRAAYFAIADEAKKQGIPFAGHVPETVKALEASDAGQKSIEHLTGVLLACSRDEEAIRADMLKALAAADESSAVRFRRLTVVFRATQTYDQQKAAALFARFKKNGTWQVPTLTVLRSTTHLDDPNFTNDSRIKYIPPSMRDYWNPKNDTRFKMYTAENWAEARKVFAKYLEVTGALQRAGVELLAGTDVSNPYCFPGFSLHDELSLLVKAGLTPMEALQAATRNPAKYLGLINSLGTVEKGKLADLVLLDANPLADISNTQKIQAVIVAGKLVTKAEIEDMLAKVEAIASQK